MLKFFGGRISGYLAMSLSVRLLLRGQRMVEPRDQHRLVGHERMERDVGRRVEHRADGEIDFALAQQFEPRLAGDVVQPHVDLRMLARVLLHERRQQVLNRRAAGRDVDGAAVGRFAERRKRLFEPVDRLDQRPGQFQAAAGHRA